MPTFSFAAMRRWASAAAESGKLRSTTGTSEPSAKPGQDVPHERGREIDLLRERPAPERRSDDAQALDEHDAQVDLRRRPGHARDEDDPSSAAKRLEVRREERAAHGIEDEVDRLLAEGLLDAAQELLAGRVDGEIRPEGDERDALLRAARRRDDGCARALRELDRGRPDARSGRMDENALSRLQAAFLEQVQIRGEPRLGNRRRVRERERGRDRHEHGARHRHFLGVAASGEQEEDALPGALHLARRLEAEDLRGARRRRVLALRLQQVGAVHGGRAHVDDDLAGAGHRIRRLAPYERFGSAGLRDEDGLHASRDSLRKRRRPGTFLEGRERRRFS